MVNPKGTYRKVDDRIKTFIENGVGSHHRTMFVIIGDKGRDQVVNLHHILSKSVVKARPSVLWCYKKELGFSSNKKKRMKKIQKNVKKAGKSVINEDDSFELFISSTDIRYCYYSETQKIMGQTFGVCVLQDFEALTPNLLARTIETVVGGGLVILLLRKMSSLKQLYTMTMDVHERYRTEVHKDIVGRFNERLILSLSACEQCLVVDEFLNVLPISSHVFDVKPISGENKSVNDAQLKIVVEHLRDTQPVGSIVSCCKTLDQAKAVLKFVEVISEKTLQYTVSLTAARGRGKSAALGLAVSAAIAFGYKFIFVTSPSPDNLKTFFEFVFKGLEALGYQEHMDYQLVESVNPDHNKAIVKVSITKNSRQTIQYIHPTDLDKLGYVELLVIDEAAAIPLPFIKNMLGPYLVFLSSTINGYEGTGRSLSLKLLNELRTQCNSNSSSLCRNLYEITLKKSIRYKPGDPIEEWLNNLLCFDIDKKISPDFVNPPPNQCDLYYVNRDTLFSYHKASELFLQKMVAIYVSSLYKYSPNDLQLLSDAPAQNIFCLLSPVDKIKKTPPEILCVIQVCLEGDLSSAFISETSNSGKKSSGDLIPWTVSQQYLDKIFPSLPGLRVVRIATHPSCQSKGYDLRAMSLLVDYYNQKAGGLNHNNKIDFQSSLNCNSEDYLLNEAIVPRSNLPPLLMKLCERSAENIRYMGVSYGLTPDLLKFWKKNHFVPVYVNEIPNELTGEHSCVMIRTLSNKDFLWPLDYWNNFRQRFSSLLSSYFHEMSPSLALNVLINKNMEKEVFEVSKKYLDCHLFKSDLTRLEKYSKNLLNYDSIDDLLPLLSSLFFLKMADDINCPKEKSLVLLGVGLQNKTIHNISVELGLSSSQVEANLNQCVSYIHKSLTQSFKSTLLDSYSGNNSEDLKIENKQASKNDKKKNRNINQTEEFATHSTEHKLNNGLSDNLNKLMPVKKRTLSMSFDESNSKETQNMKLPIKKKKKNINSLI